MDFVFWIILLVVIVGVVWWLLKRNSSSTAPGASAPERSRADGALSGGSAAASAEAAGTTGIAGAAGFGSPAEPAAPTTADDHAGAAAPAREPETAQPTGPKEREGSGASSAAAAPVATGAPGASGSTAAPATFGQDGRSQDDDEWETQWSEASGSSAVSPGAASRGGASTGAVPTHTTEVNPAGESGMPAATGHQAEAAAAPDPESHRAPIHHPEYTEPHAPTLPGAETAAVEDIDDAGTAAQAPAPAGTVWPQPATGISASAAPHGDAGVAPRHGQEDSAAASAEAAVVPETAATAETADRTQSSALVETAADRDQQPPAVPTPEPAGHLAADEPYGAGSASAGTDGSGPDGYTVKGDAGAMVYYEEGHPDYEQARADVWFESEAHAEAAGFRAPRRRRL
ncbi:sunset domain-containing protein [Pseudarthrobacter oxydans]|uniref:sunset domain-containing protein n=1 Tax=Pseudarthrobacter oxydans TaxID=1671 RepID=UPI00382B5B75